MYKRALVPLDGSPLAEAVIPFMLDIAGPLDLDVVLLTVVRPIPPQALEGSRHVVVDDVEGRMREAFEDLRPVATRLAAKGVRVSTRVRYGEPATEIAQGAREEGADLIAMTTHGYSGLSHWLHGNVAERVLHHSRVPVLMMKSFDRHEAGQIPAPHAEIRKILMPIDGSRGSEQVLPHALELSRRFDAEVTLLFVIEGESLHKHVTAAYGGQHLHALVERLRGEGERVVGATESGYPADRIVHYARHYGMDLITMATHGRTGLVHLWLGSVAEKVIRSMARPILLVRTQEETGKK